MMYSLLISGENGLSQLLEVGSSSLFWTPLIFLLSLVPIWKMVFGPITRALEERESSSRDAAAAAEAAREETERLKIAIQDDLDTARREAAKQVADAKIRAAEREKELMAAAKEEAEKERSRAKAEIEQALNNAREALRQEVVELGVGVAEQVIRREFSEADQSRLVAEFQKQANLN